MEPVKYGKEKGFYDESGKMPLGVMFHGFNYPDESGKDTLEVRLWQAVMENGILRFPRPEACKLVRIIRKGVAPKEFGIQDITSVEKESNGIESEISGGGAYELDSTAHRDV